MKISLKIGFVFLFLSLLVIRPTSSYAYWHHHDYIGVNFGVWPGPYYYGYPYNYPYYSDPYYYPAPVAVSSASYQPVVINGVTYYVNNGAYYLYTQYGYQAVAAPTGVTTSTPGVGEVGSFTINIPNDKGGYTAVVLKESGNGYIGPQGEFYSEFPKVSQLKVMYGKSGN